MTTHVPAWRGPARLLGLLLAGLVLALMWAGPASADPTPSPSPSGTVVPGTGAGEEQKPAGKPECELIDGMAKDICNGGSGSAPSLLPSQVNTAMHPIDALAEACAKMGVWFVDQVAQKVNTTTEVDFTNPGFLRQYAVAFAASTFLTIILWLIAVAKRAVKGVPPLTAFGEAFGFLWITVVVSAFAPLALYLLVNLVDSITGAIGTNTANDTHNFLTGVDAGLTPDGGAQPGLGGGAMTLVLMSIITAVVALILWVELLVREAMLYTGAILGTLVFAGLVDRSLWPHVRRWAGTMVAVLLAKPILVMVLAMGVAVGGEQKEPVDGLLIGLTIMGLAVWSGLTIYRWVPSVGDEMTQMHYARKAATTPAGIPGSGNPRGGVVGMIRQSMAADSARGNNVRTQTDHTTETTQSAGLASGIAADSSRASKSVGAKGGGSGGSAKPT
ncbi:hypothetical protein [Embleya sp. NPDC005971]|uniref:hypothetical protein n=1 Tax=Embleya sp. NPDC005971 TaxID=3156724 RepID=UPI0033D70C0C